MSNSVQKTSSQKWILALRLVAGLPLLGLGAKHFIDPEHFRSILKASGLPLVDVSMMAAPVAECLAGLLLLSGWYARIGGLLGVATMVPALVATVKIMGLEGEKPFVPPLPLPIVVLLCSALVIYFGGGAWSVDRSMSHVHEKSPLA